MRSVFEISPPMLPRASVTKALLAERVASDYSSDRFLRTQKLRKVLKLLPTVKSEVNSFENDIQTLEAHGSDTFCLKQTGISNQGRVSKLGK